MTKFFLIILFSSIGIGSLIFSHDISQRNPETIFLTEKSLKDYQVFQKDILEKHSLVIKRVTSNKDEFYKQLEKVESICVDDCEVITLRKLRKGKEGKTSNNELMKLESADYVAALILDNNDLIHKKILSFAEKNPYWNTGDTSFAGIPYTNFLLDKYSAVIQERLFPAMFVLGLLISIIFIGHLKNALIVYLPCLFSAGFSLAFLKWHQGEMNMVTSIIPLVVFTVILSLSFHLYFSLRSLKSLKAVWTVKWAPIFLMMFTTYIGFLSLGWAEILVIRSFGFISANLVAFATLYTFGWYFLWEKFILSRIIRERGEFLPVQFLNRSLKLWVIVLLGLVGIIAASLVPGKLDVITDATLYFPKEEKIREKIIAVSRTVSAMPVMEIVLDLGHDLSMEDVQKILKYETGIQSLKLSQPYKIVSNNSLVVKVNHEYSGNETLPPTIEGYFVLRGQLPISLQDSYPIEKKYRMTLIGDPLNVKEYMRDLSAISSYLSSNGLKFQVNGIHHNLMVSQNAMIDVLASSFVSSAIVIFLFSAFFLKSIRYNLIFIFVSLLPVALTFGAMYLLDFSINIATVMTFSISLGLIGDSSFHIIYAKKVRFKNFSEYCSGVLFPVVGSGLLLFSCFIIFTLNSFMPIKQFGGILGIIMLLGTLADLFILPTLLYGTNKHKEAYEVDERLV